MVFLGNLFPLISPRTTVVDDLLVVSDLVLLSQFSYLKFEKYQVSSFLLMNFRRNGVRNNWFKTLKHRLNPKNYRFMVASF